MVGIVGRVAKSFYVTTPIYYVNDVPHIGHAYTTIAADAIARWRRAWGDDVLFVTGTDEHGLKIQRAAEEHGVSPQEWVDRTSERFVETWQMLDITNDDFIRTTEPRHRNSVQAFLQTVYDNGYIVLDTYEGLYCVACEAYFTPDDLVDSRCPVHDREVEQVTEENYFFQLSRFEDRLLEYYEKNPDAVQPAGKRNEVLGFIRQGLRDFSMSRTSISWGIPLPWDERHVTYVWYDALINYLTVAGFGTDKAQFERRWPVDYHLMAKDILRFHAIYWPAMLMAAGIELPKCVFAHGYLLVGGEKMSKTRLNQIAPADLVAEVGSDGFRYHFLADQRFGPDGEFSYEAMIARYNSDLANNFGNLASRVLNMATNYCGSVTPDTRADGPLATASAKALEGCIEAFDRLDFAGAMEAVWQLIREANTFIEDREPWKLHKAGAAEETANVIGDCLEALRIIALLVAPVIPRASALLWTRLGMEGTPQEQLLPGAATWGAAVTSDNRLHKGDALFPRIET